MISIQHWSKNNCFIKEPPKYSNIPSVQKEQAPSAATADPRKPSESAEPPSVRPAPELPACAASTSPKHCVLCSPLNYSKITCFL